MHPKRRYTRDLSAPRPVKFRPQKVKFRRRYASSRVSVWISFVASGLKFGLVGGLLVYAAFKTKEIWTSSDWVRVAVVEKRGDTTPELLASLGLRRGINIITLKTSELEKEARTTHTEYARVSIQRHWDRTVSVETAYRTPVATFEGSDGRKGIDAEGVVFTRPETVASIDAPVWSGETHGVDLRRAAGGLSELKKGAPDFYKRVKFLKTDRIQPLRLVLDNDVVVVWGDLEASSALARASRVNDVLARFVPQKKFASLRFIDDDRLVMDAQWRQKH